MKDIFFQKAFLGLMTLILFPFSTFADFTPQTPAFPHGNGINIGDGVTKGACTEADPVCLDGLDFTSFNNFTDAGQGVGINDERRFLVVQNLGPQGTNTPAYADTTSVNIGDYIYVRGYIHNNAHGNDSSLDAKNVKIGINGFTNSGNNLYYSSSGSSVTVSQFINSSSATPSTITDDITVTSASGNSIKLRYKATSTSVQTQPSNNGTLHSIDTTDFISGGANVGTVKGCVNESFLTWTIFKVLDGEASTSYDLEINKYVGKDQAEADEKKKQITSSIGSSVTYRLDYGNKSTSTSTPNGTKIYDDYDESKLTIFWKPSTCTDTGSMLVCNVQDLAPGQSTHLYYVATIKSGVTTAIDNIGEIVPDNDSDRSNNSGITTNCRNLGEKNTNPNDKDTNDCNDVSSAKVILSGNDDLQATPTVEDSIIGLYIAYYNRAPDKEGFDFWSEQASLNGNEAALFAISEGFASHPQFNQDYPAWDTTAQFITKIYNNILNRAPDAGGLNFWVKQLDSGLLKSEFIVTYVNDVLGYSGSNPVGLTSKQMFTNKVVVGQCFLDALGTKYDPSLIYLYSTQVVLGVTENKESVTTAIDKIKGYLSSNATLPNSCL